MSNETIKPTKCIVHGCENRTDEGMFVTVGCESTKEAPFAGMLCGPCHVMLTRGELSPSTSFLWRLSEAVRDHLLRCKSCGGKGSYLDDGDCRTGKFQPCPVCTDLRRAWINSRLKAYL